MLAYGAKTYAEGKTSLRIADFRDRVRSEGLAVIKCSGKTLGYDTLVEIAELKAKNIVKNLVLVHGGGVQITRAMKALGMEVRFHNGYRVTDDLAMEVVERELWKINDGLSEVLCALGMEVGQFGYGVFFGKAMGGETGRYGHISQTHFLSVAEALLSGRIAVIAPMGKDNAAGKLNLNADDCAAAISVALGASEMILTTDVDGIKTGDGCVVKRIGADGLKDLLNREVVSGGMIPKSVASIYAAEHGVAVKIANGNKEGVITMATNGNEKGTTVVPLGFL